MPVFGVIIMSSTPAGTLPDAVVCVTQPTTEVHPYPASRGLAWIGALLPAACDRLMSRYGRRRGDES